MSVFIDTGAFLAYRNQNGFCGRGANGEVNKNLQAVF